MEYSRITNETIDLIEDYLQEYIDKYNLIEEDRFYSFQGNEFSKRFTYKGYYRITKVSTKIFNIDGFPEGKRGYLVKINFLRQPDEKELKLDVFKFITRVCKSGFQYDTSVDKGGSNPTNDIIKYYIAFFE